MGFDFQLNLSIVIRNKKDQNKLYNYFKKNKNLFKLQNEIGSDDVQLENEIEIKIYITLYKDNYRINKLNFNLIRTKLMTN